MQRFLLLVCLIAIVGSGCTRRSEKVSKETAEAGKNLLGEKREFTQGPEIQRIYEPGRKVSLSLSYTPF